MVKERTFVYVKSFNIEYEMCHESTKDAITGLNSLLTNLLKEHEFMDCEKDSDFSES